MIKMSKTAIINNVRYQHKHETQENWNKATNFIPLAGELIVYDIDTTHSMPRLKIGDGVVQANGTVQGTNVNDLPFIDATINEAIIQEMIKAYVDEAILGGEW